MGQDAGIWNLGAARRALCGDGPSGDGAVAYALSIYRPCVESEATFEEHLLTR